jgi:hypothetical protein
VRNNTQIKFYSLLVAHSLSSLFKKSNFISEIVSLFLFLKMCLSFISEIVSLFYL